MTAVRDLLRYCPEGEDPDAWLWSWDAQGLTVDQALAKCRAAAPQCRCGSGDPVPECQERETDG